MRSVTSFAPLNHPTPTPTLTIKPASLPARNTLNMPTLAFSSEKKPNWIDRNISQPLANRLGNRFNLSKKWVAGISSGATLLLITLAHAPLVPIINKGVVKNYQNGLDTYKEAEDLGKVFEKQCGNCKVTYEIDPNTKQKRMVITETTESTDSQANQ